MDVVVRSPQESGDMRKLLSPFIAALAVLVACSSSKPAPLGMGRGYVGADGKPTIMFTVDDGK
jgi:hypothetical protein